MEHVVSSLRNNATDVFPDNYELRIRNYEL